MTQAARTVARSTRAPRTRQQWAILRRISARRQAPATTRPAAEPKPAGMLAACLDAAGFSDHQAHYA